VIDVHVHAFPDALATRGTMQLADHAGITPAYDGTVAGLVAAMDRSGVDVSIIQPVATKPGQVVTINDWAATLRAPGSPWADRIVAFGAMHPDFPDPGAEIARMRGLGLPGIKMHPDYQQFVPTEHRMQAVYAAAVDNEMWMLLHAGRDIGPQSEFGTPQAYATVLDTWPDLKVILAHLGGWRLWEAVAEHVIGRDVYLDTAYTPGHLPDAEFVALVREHGTDRVLFGSDGPWADAGAEIDKLRATGLSAGELEAILGDNAACLIATFPGREDTA
jgi:predicted TIM-barrel fold metal-dependent hydrolase